MAELKALPIEKRRLSAEATKAFREALPMDGLTLTPDMLGAEYFVTNVFESTFGKEKRKTFTITLRNADRTINIPASQFRRSRVLGEDVTVKPEDFYRGNQNMLLRSKADEVWAGSHYIHQDSANDSEIVIPAKLKIEYAVIASSQDKPDTAVMNSFLYKGYRKFVDNYLAENDGTFPRWEDFVEHCMATDGKEPQLMSHVKDGEPASTRFNLIFKDVED